MEKWELSKRGRTMPCENCEVTHYCEKNRRKKIWCITTMSDLTGITKINTTHRFLIYAPIKKLKKRRF